MENYKPKGWHLIIAALIFFLLNGCASVQQSSQVRKFDPKSLLNQDIKKSSDHSCTKEDCKPPPEKLIKEPCKPCEPCEKVSPKPPEKKKTFFVLDWKTKKPITDVDLTIRIFTEKEHILNPDPEGRIQVLWEPHAFYQVNAPGYRPTRVQLWDQDTGQWVNKTNVIYLRPLKKEQRKAAVPNNAFQNPQTFDETNDVSNDSGVIETVSDMTQDTEVFLKINSEKSGDTNNSEGGTSKEVFSIIKK